MFSCTFVFGDGRRVGSESSKVFNIQNRIRKWKWVSLAHSQFIKIFTNSTHLPPMPPSPPLFLPPSSPTLATHSYTSTFITYHFFPPSIHPLSLSLSLSLSPSSFNLRDDVFLLSLFSHLKTKEREREKAIISIEMNKRMHA